jgi:hypothetical protein
MNRTSLALLRPMIGKTWLANKGIDQSVLIGGNLLLFLVSLITFLITYRSLKAKNPNIFVRAMYGGFIIKFFVVAIAAFIYIMVTKEHVNKPALFICMGLYVLYTFFEVSSLIRVLKQKKNA